MGSKEVTYLATTDATSVATLSSGVETGRNDWNGGYYSIPVGVNPAENRTYRTVLNIPIDFAAIAADNGVVIESAQLKLRYFKNLTYRKTDSIGNRTLNLHNLFADFTQSPGTTSTTWGTSTTQNWNSRTKNAVNWNSEITLSATDHYDSNVIADVLMDGDVPDKSEVVIDITDWIGLIAPSSMKVHYHGELVDGLGAPSKGLLLKTSSIAGHNKSVEFYSVEGAVAYSTSKPQIVIQYWQDTKPTKPVITSPKNDEYISTPNVTLTSEFSDPDGDLVPMSYEVEVYNEDINGDLIASTNVESPTSATMTATFPISLFTSNISYFWRVRAQDEWGLWSDWTTDVTASFTAPTYTGVPVDPETNPNFATTKTIARNKYRIEFYPLLASLKGFDPQPSAIIFDAKKIGISQQVNGVGEVFFTLPSNHAQIGAIMPQRTFWRACRWDETDGFFRVMGEGLIVKSVSYPNEVVFYGIDKLGIYDRKLASTDTSVLNSTYTHVDVTLAELHDDILNRSRTSASITNVTIPIADTVRYTCANTFRSGEVVSITGISPSQYNLPLVTITARTSTYFEVKSAITGAFVSGGTATPANNVLDMGWGETPVSKFRDYSVTNGTNATATSEKSVKVIGIGCATALSSMADLVMAGTSDKVIIDNPNIGEPAAAIETMSVGLRHRHETVAQQSKPDWWLKYRTNLKRYVVSDNLDMVATRSSIINSTVVASANDFTLYNGVTDPVLYAQYGLIDKLENVKDMGDKIDYAATMQYNLQPDRLFTIDMDIVPNSIVPFKGYQVGDNLVVYIVDDEVAIAKELTIVAQQWIGNANGAEFLAMGFSQKIEKKFLTADQAAPLLTESAASTSTQSIPFSAQSSSQSTYSWSNRTKR